MRDEQKMIAAVAYVQRSLSQRRRARDRPSQIVLEGLELIIQRARSSYLEDSSNSTPDPEDLCK